MSLALPAFLNLYLWMAWSHFQDPGCPPGGRLHALAPGSVVDMLCQGHLVEPSTKPQTDGSSYPCSMAILMKPFFLASMTS